MLTKIESLFGSFASNIGLLVLRLGAGGFMLTGHGWGKLTGFGEHMNSFPDPLGISSPVSMALAVGAEFFCSALVMMGAATRLACIPLAITMLVAVFIIHADDPWGKKELALMYLVPWITLFLTGPGAFSVDRVLLKRR